MGICAFLNCTVYVSMSSGILELYRALTPNHAKTHLFVRDQHRFRRRQWHPTPVLLPRKFHGRRSLVGCSPWARQESDTTERLHFHFSLSCIGGGNGNPLQNSCLENPRDVEHRKYPIQVRPNTISKKKAMMTFRFYKNTRQNNNIQ